MFQNLVITGLTPLYNTNEIINWDNRPFEGKWPENQHSVRGTEVKKTIRKKPKRIRTAYSTDQLRVLEQIYSRSKYIDAKRRKELSGSLNIGDKALKIWFQNRRMKEKKEASESSCDTSSEIMSCQSPFKENEIKDVLTGIPISNHKEMSSEIVSCQSPFKENEVKDFLANVPHSNHNEVYESAQYQFPSYFYNGNTPGVECQNGYPYIQDGVGFGVDSCVYPTQYYPTYTYNGGHFSNTDAYGSNLCNGQENWYANSCGLTYFQ